ncbi:hypothetical protein MXMO3_01773 [Maritalea myrionectae]|uniref:Methyltransferase small domain-containing protein n=1 Tax=Maritalea myrionectae TaxID=454601 RepID=A0A2R4ME32_9HYPH|nr:methyltransferase [Maritalea myrionectae]AVX04298.1 hypothetical protein MXMO3_01773 [Maritalea myrionectae]
MTVQVPQPVMEVLDRAIIDGSALQLTGQLDRKLYVETNKVLEAAGGKWNRKAKAHIFDGEALDAIEPILLTGEYARTKQDFGQFDSPEEVVGLVIQLARIEPGMSVLEPSAGIGNIAIAAERAGGKVVAVEIDTKRFSVLNADPKLEAIHANFLEWSDHARFDRVVMNPPFARQADVHHVNHAHRFLKSGGLLVAIMSASVMFRDNGLTREFRAFVERQGGTIERLPDHSFKASGTAVHTCIVAIPALTPTAHAI